MKATALMIGDWILCSDNIQRQVRYLQVRPSVIGIGGSSYDEDEIQPIPLTPEILEQNGFEYYDNPVKVLMTNTINGHYVEIRLDRKEIAIWYDYDENNDGVYSDCLFPLPYWLHDFQHALRLCGINKEIEI